MLNSKALSRRLPAGARDQLGIAGRRHAVPSTRKKTLKAVADILDLMRAALTRRVLILTIS